VEICTNPDPVAKAKIMQVLESKKAQREKNKARKKRGHESMDAAEGATIPSTINSMHTSFFDAPDNLVSPGAVSGWGGVEQGGGHSFGEKPAHREGGGVRGDGREAIVRIPGLQSETAVLCSMSFFPPLLLYYSCLFFSFPVSTNSASASTYFRVRLRGVI